ncbi:hypothetical protein [Mobilicoccus pelagius]|uniref:Putative phosphotransferase n=1 Tax=Mobilicoccus pelagius NBRC 104925 TaxID=1089455 RepID=H5UMM9_9MICO|nr:hypothetical protein [Mobilicoccus pelagius]GAB46987.1 putative phosphotransferase [Mobilicoccus pelagius NBRC 104925]
MTETPTATDRPAEDAEGRLFVLTGPGADDVARALTAALPRAASVDGAVVEAMFTGEGGVAPSDARTELERRYLRYTAGIALADSFRFAGYDAVVAEDVPGEHLEAYLDFAEPAPVHLVHLTGGAESADDTGAAGDAGPGRGLVLAGDEPRALAAQIVERADEARVDPPAADAQD